jgi:type II secretory pathway pseudopilin PulG
MSPLNKNSKGFTIAEMVIVVSLVALVSIIFANFFSDNFKSYLQLQQTTVTINTLNSSSQRIARVVRGMTTITDASEDTLSGFAYFTPRDDTLSKVRYFFDSQSNSIKVGVTPASGSAPNYNYNPVDEVITTVAEGVVSTKPIFLYKDSSGTNTEFTTETYKDIKAINIDLVSTAIPGKSVPLEISTTVTLRNRKTNL